MRFRCPSCLFTGQVRIPAHFPRGKSARIRCARCQRPFALAVGKLWPQDTPEAYDALVPGALGCAGERIGKLWVEIAGARSGTPPLVALQPHPSFSHEIMHDLLDPFREYFPICYLEFPGSPWNPDPSAGEDLFPALIATLDLLKVKLKAPKLHLLAVLDSCRLALRVSEARPKDVASMLLVEPLFKPHSSPAEEFPQETTGPSPAAAAEAVRALIGENWQLPQEEVHLRGLARVLSAGFSPERFHQGESSLVFNPSFRRLSRLRVPALILSSRDGSPAGREASLNLAGSMPAAEQVQLEKGGGMAAWYGGTWFSNKLLSFKRGAEKETEQRIRRRPHMVSGQPVGWMAALFAAIVWGLAASLSRFSLEPDFMRQVIPPFLGSLLPILWFLLPRRLNPFALLRFRAFRVRTVLLPFVIGVFLGFGFFSLNAAGLAWRPPLPAIFSSLALASPGRPYLFLALAFSALFVFGFVQNLLTLRRSAARLPVPILLFLLVPLSFPDALWLLPASIASTLLFAGSLSLYAPLFLLAGTFFGSELPVPYPAIAAGLAGPQGWILALALLVGAGFLTALGATGERGYSMEDLYFAASLNKGEKAYRWHPAGGAILVIFSLIGAAGLVFGFLRF